MIHFLKAKLNKGLLNKDLFQLIGSGYFTQFISLLLLPVLVRLYQPADFGDFSMYIAVSSGIGTLASLRYELAFFSVKNSISRNAVLIVNLFLAFVMPVVYFAILYVIALFTTDLFIFLNHHLISIYIGAVLMSLQMIFLAWHNALGEYKKISNSRIIQSLTISLLPIFIYPLHLSSQALIISQISGLFGSILFLYKGITLQKTKKNNLIWVVRNFYKNTVVGVPHILSDVIGAIMLNACITQVYGSDVLGFFSIAQRFKNILNTIGASYGIMFNKKITNTTEDSFALKVKQLKNLILPMLGIYVGLLLFANVIISLFGQKWAQAIEMTKILALQFILTSIIAGFGAYFYLKNRQTTGFLLGLCFTVANVIAVVIPQNLFFGGLNPSINLAMNMLVLTFPILLMHIVLIFKRI